MVTNKIKALIELTRPYNMVSGVLLFNIGYFFVSGSKGINSDYLIDVAAIILAMAFATIQNDIEDIGIDKINSPNKHLISGRLTIREAAQCNNILFIFILSLSLFHFPKHLFFISGLLLLIWAYNRPPFLLSRKPYWSIVILAAAYSSLPLYQGMAMRSNPFSIGLSLIIFYFILRCSISMLKDYKDATGDKLYQKRTFYLVYGARATGIVSLTLALIAYGGILYYLVSTRLVSWPMLIPFLLAAKLIYDRTLLLTTIDEQKLTIYFHKIFFGQNLMDLSYILCLILLQK